MDPAEEGLYQLILDEGGLPAEWRDEPLFHECLSELASCGLERLTSEPRRLEEAHKRLQEQNQELASANYQTFIRTAECSKEIAQDFTTVEAQLEQLLSRIPAFSTNCETFMSEAMEISASRRLSALTLLKHTQVLEILEIPQLMDTCVRNSHCDEALELVNYVKRLERKHSAIPMVASVVSEVRRSTQALLHKLVGQLKGELKLPTCLKVIGYLRRMDVFSERELRLKFLQARDMWLQSLLQSIPRDDAFHHVSKVIEITRVTIFDVITQFRAVFSDEDPLLLTSGPPGSGAIAPESALFHSWLALKLNQFLATLEADLMRGGEAVASRFDALLGQCLYFGLSFGRVGCDFRARLPEIFQRAILYHFRAGLEAGARSFEEAIHRYSFCLPVGNSRGAKGLADSTEVAAPAELLAFPPLSLLTNQLLTALNRLRLCAALNLCREVVEALQLCLWLCVRALTSLHRNEGGAFSTQETTAFGQLCDAMTGALFDHLNRCLALLFPPKELALYLGLSRAELERQRIGALDLPALTEPLRPFLRERVPSPDAGEPHAETVKSDIVSGEPDNESPNPDIISGEPDNKLPNADVISGEADNELSNADIISGETDVVVSKPDYVSGEPDLDVPKADFVSGRPDDDVSNADIVSGEPVLDVPKLGYVFGGPDNEVPNSDIVSGNPEDIKPDAEPNDPDKEGVNAANDETGGPAFGQEDELRTLVPGRDAAEPPVGVEGENGLVEIDGMPSEAPFAAP